MDSRGDAEISSFLSLFAALSYGIASMAMVFINKAILMQYAHSMTLLTLQVALSVILTAAGVVIAALGDFSFDFFGYSMALTSVFFQTMYLVLVEKSGAEDGLSSVEIMFYNSFLSLPFLLLLIIATGEFPNSLSLLFAKDQPNTGME